MKTLWPARCRISLFRSRSMSEASALVESWTNCQPNTASFSTSIILHYTVICWDSPYVEVHSAPYKRTHLEARLQLQTLARNVSRNVIPGYQRFGNTPVKIIPSSALNWSWRSQDGAMPVKRSWFGAWKHVGYMLARTRTLRRSSSITQYKQHDMLPYHHS